MGGPLVVGGPAHQRERRSMATFSGLMKPVMLAGFAATTLCLAQAARAQEDQPAARAPEQKGPRLDFPAGLATDSATVWCANSRNNTIVAIGTASRSISIVAGELFKDGSNDGTGTSAHFKSPDGLAVVGRNLYVADTNNSDIRKVNVDSHVVSTAAGVANIPGTDDGAATSAHFN